MERSARPIRSGPDPPTGRKSASLSRTRHRVPPATVSLLTRHHAREPSIGRCDRLLKQSHDLCAASVRGGISLVLRTQQWRRVSQTRKRLHRGLTQQCPEGNGNTQSWAKLGAIRVDGVWFVAREDSESVQKTTWSLLNVAHTWHTQFPCLSPCGPGSRYLYPPVDGAAINVSLATRSLGYPPLTIVKIPLMSLFLTHMKCILYLIVLPSPAQFRRVWQPTVGLAPCPGSFLQRFLCRSLRCSRQPSL